MTISCWILLRMRNVSSKNCEENQNTHFLSSNFFLPKIVCKLMSKKIVEPERPQKTIWRHVLCWIIKAKRAQAHACYRDPHTHTHKRAHTFGIWDDYCFSTATVAYWVRLNVTLNIPCLSCLLQWWCSLLWHSENGDSSVILSVARNSKTISWKSVLLLWRRFVCILTTFGLSSISQINVCQKLRQDS
jgi:hypothetical protein